MTREEAFKDINETQEFYINELISELNKKDRSILKSINFTSPTGTGKTKMISLLISKLPNIFFIITTLSKGQLNIQVEAAIKEFIPNSKNYRVYGASEVKSNTNIKIDDVISNLPKDKKIIWIRDEGHIATNVFMPLEDFVWKIINFSATNKNSDGIICNFTHTMMLRTVSQEIGTPDDALDKLLEIKKEHTQIKNYNPCAIMRCLDSKINQEIIAACKKRNLKYIDISDDSYYMTDLCKDDNEYDVIINKFKLIEGIDIRRAHVLYLTNEPSNPATTIQAIGRCRRNALLYRDDVDIFTDDDFREKTMKCFVFYNVDNMHIDTDENNELQVAFCNQISCQDLKVGSNIEVKDGVLTNGLTVLELIGKTGNFTIKKDEKTGFNFVDNEDFYKEKITNNEPRLNGYTEKECKNIIKRVGWDSIYLGSNVIQLPIKISDCYNIECSPYTTDNGTPAVITSYYDENPELKLPEILNNEIKITWRCKNYKLHYFKTIEARDKYIKKQNEKSYKLDLKIINIPFKYYDFDYRRSFCFTEQETDMRTISINSQDYGYVYRSMSSFKKDDIFQYFKKLSYKPYKKINNDRELAIIGTDLMKPIRINNKIKWVEDSAITSKVGKYCKLRRFIRNKYSEEIKNSSQYLFTGKNSFSFSKKLNSCLGYCSEYYAKYLLYGEEFLKFYIDAAKKENKGNIRQSNPNNQDHIIIRACILKYKDQMKSVYGFGTSKIIQTISVEQLIKDELLPFIQKVKELGENIYNFIKNSLSIDPNNIKNEYDPNLSVAHITGIADFIIDDKIIDVKCTNSITLDYINQVLMYHYLSTKRNDLNIKEVIIFDAVSKKFVRIKISENNLKNN